MIEIKTTQELQKRYPWFFSCPDESQKMRILEVGLMAHGVAHETAYGEATRDGEILREQERQHHQKQLAKMEEKLSYHQEQQQSLIEADRQQQRLLYEGRMTGLEQQLADANQHLKARIQEEREHLSRLHEKQALQTEKIYQKQIQQHVEKITKLEEKLESGHNNKFKGTVGEDTVMCFLSKRFPDCLVEKVANTKHGGDIKLVTPPHLGSRTVIFEVRNYQNAVSAERRQTLERDIHEQEADAGILVSLQSGIVGRKHMELEVTKLGKPIVYLSNALDSLHDILGGLSMIHSYTTLENVTFGDSERQGMLEVIQRQTGEIAELNKQIAGLQQLKKKLVSSNQRLLEIVEPSSSNTEEFTVAKLKSLLKSKKLPTTGKRMDLLKRWQQHQQEQEQEQEHQQEQEQEQ